MPGASRTPSFADKWFEILRDCLPQLAHIALVVDPGSGRAQVASITEAASRFRIKAETLDVNTRADYGGAFAAARNHGAQAILLPSSPLVISNVKELADLSLRHRLPSITLFSEFVSNGGLLAYGPSLVAVARQSAVMVAKVLAGTAPANLALERPSTFELHVNQLTATEIGVNIPAVVTGRADVVIN